MKNPDRQHIKDLCFMRQAIATAGMSQCVKARYGAVIVDRNGHVVSTGYNGKPAGSQNDGQCYRLNVLPDTKRHACCLHAETNALQYCDRHKSEGGTLYINGVPCEMCSLAILQAGIKRLVYIPSGDSSGHARNSSGSTDDFWERCSIPIERVALTLEEISAADDWWRTSVDYARQVRELQERLESVLDRNALLAGYAHHAHCLYNFARHMPGCRTVLEDPNVECTCGYEQTICFIQAMPLWVTQIAVDGFDSENIRAVDAPDISNPAIPETMALLVKIAAREQRYLCVEAVRNHHSGNEVVACAMQNAPAPEVASVVEIWQNIRLRQSH